MSILYFITPFTICLPIKWRTHTYSAVWTNCNMFREYSNTPYLAVFVGLLQFWYWCVFSDLYGFFLLLSYFNFYCFEKCFLQVKILQKYWGEKVCRFQRTLQAHVLAYTVIWSIFGDAHKLSFFSFQDGGHRFFSQYLLNIGQQGICMCVCFCI